MTAAMVHDLQVVHRLKDTAGGGLPAGAEAHLRRHGLFIDTCQRQLCIRHAGRPQPGGLSAAATHLHGRAAYTLLLQTITGLNSSVAGETNVHGQFKRQWEAWRTQVDAGTARLVNPVMRMLLEDGKRIRELHLQGIGGQSYGSAVRKLLRPQPQARLLFIGCGELALSMLNLFDDWETGLWNRHAIAPPARFKGQVFAPTAQRQAADWATHLVFTTPPDAGHDRQWLEQLHTGIAGVVHLGRRRADRGPWQPRQQAPAGASWFHDLDDVFDLQRQQSALRSMRLLQARYACAVLASQRSQTTPAPLLAGQVAAAQRACG